MQSVVAFIKGLAIPRELVAFIVSMLPVIELRGGLPVASAMGMNPFWGIIICMLGNLLPIPFILWLIIPIFKWLKSTKLLKPLVEALERKAEKNSEKIKKSEFWGLMLFVAIPLPGTGAWTGALVAAMLGLDFKKALLAIFLGVCIAGAVVSVLSYGIPWLISVL